jgi:7-carboxy-7-deazaguanine synthase
MLGKNKILKSENHDGNYLDVQDIFFTLQGEGPNVGMPAIFIRLGGCNLACEFCDTEFESYNRLTLIEILDKIKDILQKKPKTPLVVITGGEPMRQPIAKLCQKLQDLNLLVQIETNGTIFRDLPKDVQIICSPKINNKKYYPIRPDLLPRITAFKFIIEKDGIYNKVCEIGQSQYNIPVYIQPLDGGNLLKNKENLQFAIKLCLENGYLLSLQTHKIIGLP